MMLNFITPVLACAALSLATASWAGRPLNTEDADILDQGACELEGLIGHTKSSGTPRIRDWATQVGCGVGYRTQVSLAYGQARGDGSDEKFVTLGGKTGLLLRDKGSLGVSLAWGVGSLDNDVLSWKHEESYLTLVFSKELAPGITGHANVGWSRSESAKQSTTLWNLAAEWAVQEKVDLTAEVYGDDRVKDPVVGLGVRYNISKEWMAHAAYNWTTSSPKVDNLTVGLKFSF
jgi:hypothetical protein